MEKYFINFYKDKDGSKVKGNWKNTEDEADEERLSHLYTVKLDLEWQQMASIEKSKVEEISKENNMSISDVLNCL